ncbi:hypothetical protein IWZ00DRAFT_6903 [Phyllosticta capitalensis]
MFLLFGLMLVLQSASRPARPKKKKKKKKKRKKERKSERFNWAGKRYSWQFDMILNVVGFQNADYGLQITRSTTAKLLPIPLRNW